jgi:hypothetical protein
MGIEGWERRVASRGAMVRLIREAGKRNCGYYSGAT